MVDFERYSAQILANPFYFSSILVFLSQMGRELPQQPIDWISGGRQALPALDNRWLEALLTGCLFQDRNAFGEDHPVMADLRRRLKRMGAVERRRVRLSSGQRMDRLLSINPSKLQSIVRIAQAEQQALGSELRMAVLADYIRLEELPSSKEEERAPQKIGVVPIFESLRRELPPQTRLAVLTGSLAVIPAAAPQAFLDEAAQKCGVGLSARCRAFRPKPPAAGRPCVGKIPWE